MTDGQVMPWPLTDQHRADIAADLAMEQRALERIDSKEPLPHMVAAYLERRASSVREIARLRSLLDEDGSAK